MLSRVFSDHHVCIMGWALFWMLYGMFQALGSALGVFLYKYSSLMRSDLSMLEIHSFVSPTIGIFFGCWDQKLYIPMGRFLDAWYAAI